MVDKLAPTDCCNTLHTFFFQGLTWLLTVPGASRTVLEARIPYAQSALQKALKFPTASYASVGTAVDMAKAAYKQAAQLSQIGTSIIGIGCTCALMTDRVKKGDHKACATYLAETHAWLTRLHGLQRLLFILAARMCISHHLIRATLPSPLPLA